MGRPISKRYIGNTSQSGQQIQATAWFAGDTQARTSYIAKQVGANSYNMVDIGGTHSGRVTLANGGTTLSQGQANITVTPFGSSGSGATATANLGIKTVTVGAGGTGGTSGYYVPGEILALSGGTATAGKGGNVFVDSVGIGASSPVSGGPGYAVGDKFIWNYAGFSTPAVLTVASVSGNGNISTINITNSGVSTNVQITNTTPFSSSVQSNAWANTATFVNRWDVKQLSVVNVGDYSVAPSNNVSTTGSSHGTGATAVIGWEVSSVQVTAGGVGYQAAKVTFGSGSAKATASVNNVGNVSAIIVNAAGGPYSNAAPTVTVLPIASLEYAAEIKNRTVTTFAGNTYDWVMSNVTMTASNQATIRSA